MPVLVGLEYPNIKRLHARVRTAGKEKGTILWRLAGRINKLWSATAAMVVH
jgi:hypothetical protein